MVLRSARILRQSFGTVRSAAFRRSALSFRWDTWEEDRADGFLYRKRRRQGLRSVHILLPVTDIDYFIRVVLTERQRQRPDALETGLAGLIHQILEEIRDARARVTGNDAVTSY